LSLVNHPARGKRAWIVSVNDVHRTCFLKPGCGEFEWRAQTPQVQSLSTLSLSLKSFGKLRPSLFTACGTFIAKKVKQGTGKQKSKDRRPRQPLANETITTNGRLDRIEGETAHMKSKFGLAIALVFALLLGTTAFANGPQTVKSSSAQSSATTRTMNNNWRKKRRRHHRRARMQRRATQKNSNTRR
jgi:hypothetical protein